MIGEIASMPNGDWIDDAGTIYAFVDRRIKWDALRRCWYLALPGARLYKNSYEECVDALLQKKEQKDGAAIQ